MANAFHPLLVRLRMKLRSCGKPDILHEISSSHKTILNRFVRQSAQNDVSGVGDSSVVSLPQNDMSGVGKFFSRYAPLGMTWKKMSS